MEFLDVVDEHGNPTGQIIERERAHREGIRHRTSHVWLIRVENGRPQVLLQLRSINKDSFPGCYDISSAGHIPAGCSFEESAIRELKEELGVAVGADELVICGDRFLSIDDSFHGKPFHDRQVSRIFYYLTDIDEKAFILQKEEVAGVIWMDFEECFSAVRENRIKHCIFPDELEMVKSALRENHIFPL